MRKNLSKSKKKISLNLLNLYTRPQVSHATFNPKTSAMATCPVILREVQDGRGAVSPGWGKSVCPSAGLPERSHGNQEKPMRAAITTAAERIRYCELAFLGSRNLQLLIFFNRSPPKQTIFQFFIQYSFVTT